MGPAFQKWFIYKLTIGTGKQESIPLKLCGDFGLVASVRLCWSFIPPNPPHTLWLDQSFSWTSTRLKRSDSKTLGDMHDEQRKCYNDFTVLNSMREVVNCSGLFQQTKWCNKVRQLTQYRYFRFVPEEVLNIQPNDTCAETSKGHWHVVCNVKRTVDDIWQPLEESNRPGVTSFFNFVPSLDEISPDLLTGPTDIDKFKAGIESEKSTIDE